MAYIWVIKQNKSMKRCHWHWHWIYYEKKILCSAEKSSVIWAEPHSRSLAEQLGRTTFGRSLVQSTYWIFIDLFALKSFHQHFFEKVCYLKIIAACGFVVQWNVTSKDKIKIISVFIWATVLDANRAIRELTKSKLAWVWEWTINSKCF